MNALITYTTEPVVIEMRSNNHNFDIYQIKYFVCSLLFLYIQNSTCDLTKNVLELNTCVYIYI